MVASNAVIPLNPDDSPNPPTLVPPQRSWGAWCVEKTGWSEERFLSFAGHLTSYLPTAIIVGIGGMVGISSDKLLNFWMFASTTISVEVCISCLRAKYASVERYGQAAIEAETKDEREYFAERLDTAKRLRKWCWLFVALVLTSWMLVAVCEVWHISENGGTASEGSQSVPTVIEGNEVDHVTESGEAKPDTSVANAENAVKKTDGEKAHVQSHVTEKSPRKVGEMPPLPDWNGFAIGFLNAFNLLIAFWKIWQLAGEHVREANDSSWRRVLEAKAKANEKVLGTSVAEKPSAIMDDSFNG